MTLIARLTRIRDDSLLSLDASHNYYAHTKSAWRLVQQIVRRGHQVSIRNLATGHTVDETELPGLAQEYVTGYLMSATFQDFVSHFERFTFEFLRAWLTEYPGSMSGNELKFRTVLDATGKDDIIAEVVEKEVLGLAYKRVADWFAYLENKAQLGCPTQDQIQQIAEIKASRDILVHNNGVANAIYIDKSMGRARFADGDKLTLTEQYHRASWERMKQVVTDVSNTGINKLSL